MRREEDLAEIVVRAITADARHNVAPRRDETKQVAQRRPKVRALPVHDRELATGANDVRAEEVGLPQDDRQRRTLDRAGVSLRFREEQLFALRRSERSTVRL